VEDPVTKAPRGKLTDKFVETLQPFPDGRERIVRDGALAGFLIRVGRRLKTFEIRIERRGRPKVHHRLGHWPDTKAEEARGLAHDVLGKFEKKEPIKARPGEATLATMLPLYLQKLDDDDASEWTTHWYTQSIGRLSEDFQHMPLRELAAAPVLLADEIVRIRKRLTGSPRKGLSAGTSTARAVKAVFRFAQRRDPALLGDPTSAVKKSDPKRDDLPVLGETDLMAWWAAVEKIPNEVKRWALLFTVLTGLRRATVVAIELKDIDLKRRCVRIKRPKGGSAFDQILSRAMIRVLWRARQASRQIYRDNAERYVFAGPKGHMRGDALNREDVEANHALRRSFSTLARHAGIPKDMVKVFLHHGESDVTDRYVRTSKLGALYGVAAEEISLFILRGIGGGRVPHGLG
jgi:integrase